MKSENWCGELKISSRKGGNWMILSCSFSLWLSPHLIRGCRDSSSLLPPAFLNLCGGSFAPFYFVIEISPRNNKRDRKRTGNRPSKNKNANADHDD